MLLEKVSIHTEILFVHCYKFFFNYYLFFFCVCWKENCILLPKGINEFVVFLCIVHHVWFWFVTLLPRFLLLVIKGQFFPRTTILFQSAIFFNKNLGKRVTNQNHTWCTIHRNTTNSFIPLGSNIQFSFQQTQKKNK
jgi:hypothetical protein